MGFFRTGYQYHLRDRSLHPETPLSEGSGPCGPKAGSQVTDGETIELCERSFCQILHPQGSTHPSSCGFYPDLSEEEAAIRFGPSLKGVFSLLSDGHWIPEHQSGIRDWISAQGIKPADLSPSDHIEGEETVRFPISTFSRENNIKKDILGS